MLSVNNRDYYFYSLSIQEVLTTRPCGYPAGCSRYVVPISVTISVTVSVTAALLLLTSMKYPVRSLQESKLAQDRKSTRLNSSHVAISYAGFCLKKKKRARG